MGVRLLTLPSPVGISWEGIRPAARFALAKTNTNWNVRAIRSRSSSGRSMIRATSSVVDSLALHVATKHPVKYRSDVREEVWLYSHVLDALDSHRVTTQKLAESFAVDQVDGCRSVASRF
jgi:hypothetical protein